MGIYVSQKVLQHRIFRLLLTAQLLSKIADALSSSKTILPWLLQQAGAAPFFIGALTPIRESGSLLPQSLVGHYVQQHTKRSPAYTAGSLLQALTIALIGLSSLYVAGNTFAWLVLLLLFFFSLARSLCSVASKDVIGKTIEKDSRGTLIGNSASIAGAVTITVGLALIASHGKNWSHLGWLLSAAAIAWLFAGLAYRAIKEPNSPTQSTTTSPSLFRDAFQLIIYDKQFRHFVVVRGLLLSSALATPYYVVLAQQQNTSLNQLGLFVVCAGIADFSSGYIWGKWANHHSRHLLVITALMVSLMCLISLAAILISAPGIIYVALFFLISVVHQGVRVARKTYVINMAEGNQRTRYVANSNTMIGCLLLALGLSYALISQVSLFLVFIALLFSSIAAAFFARHLS